MKKQLTIYLLLMMMILTACKRSQSNTVITENNTEAVTSVKAPVVYKDDYYVQVRTYIKNPDKYTGNSFTKIIMDANQYPIFIGLLDNVAPKITINNPYIHNGEYEYKRSMYTWTYYLMEIEKRMVSHHYYNKNGKSDMTIDIDDEGNIISYAKHIPAIIENKNLNDEELEEIAKMEILKFIDNETFETYELDEIEKYANSNFSGIFFMKKAYGYDTEQRIRVYIFNNGEVMSLYLEDYQKWHNIFKDTNLQQEKLDTTADKLMNLIDTEIGLDEETWKKVPKRDEMRLHIDDSGNVYVYVIGQAKEGGNITYYAIVR